MASVLEAGVAPANSAIDGSRRATTAPARAGEGGDRTTATTATTANLADDI